MDKIFITLTVIATIGLLIIYPILVVKSIRFEQNCIGHLKRAADANTIELAQKELKTAIDYLEANNITTGYTSVLWRTPDEDVEYWYSNIKASYEELENLPADATQLEKTNVLMKLRETLTDDTEHGTKVTKPRGISRYPNNKAWGWARGICWLFGFPVAIIALALAA